MNLFNSIDGQKNARAFRLLRASTGFLLVILAVSSNSAKSAENSEPTQVVQQDPRQGMHFEPEGSPAPVGRYGDPTRPNLSGIWQMTGEWHLHKIGEVHWTPAYAANLAHAHKMLEAGTPIADSTSECIAFGMPRFMVVMFELIQVPDEIVMLSSMMMDWRRIYLDGKGHSIDFDPSYNGDSIGHWEGEELVVETNNFLANIVETTGVGFSDKLSIVERFRRTSSTEMEVTFTLTDPDALTRPFTFSRKFRLVATGTRLEDARCTNNRNKADESGKQSNM